MHETRTRDMTKKLPFLPPVHLRRLSKKACVTFNNCRLFVGYREFLRVLLYFVAAVTSARGKNCNAVVRARHTL